MDKINKRKSTVIIIILIAITVIAAVTTSLKSSNTVNKTTNVNTTSSISESVINEKTDETKSTNTTTEPSTEVTSLPESSTSENNDQEKVTTERKTTKTETTTKNTITEKKEVTKKETTTKEKTTKKQLPEKTTTSFEKEIFNLINDYRKSAGVKELKWSSTLHNLAAIRAEESSVKWSHTRPNGKNFVSVFNEYGIDAGYVGENLANGPQDAEKIMKALMNSSSHKKNILSSSFSQVGVSAYIDSRGNVYIAQEFAE